MYGQSFINIDKKDVKEMTNVYYKKIIKENKGFRDLRTKINNEFNKASKCILSKHLDLITIMPLYYIQYSKFLNFKPFVESLTYGDIEEKFSILVSKDKNINGLEDLKNRKSEIVTIRSGILPRIWLEAGLNKSRLEQNSGYVFELIDNVKSSKGILLYFTNSLMPVLKANFYMIQ